MKKIIGMVRPFEMQQSLVVYEDGNKIDICQTTLDDLNTNLFMLMDKHNVYRLDFVGPKKFLNGLSEQIKTAAATKYTENTIEINII